MNSSKIILVDGYNVIHRIVELKKEISNSLRHARSILLHHARNYIGTRKDILKMYLIFDGKDDMVQEYGLSGGQIEVVFSTGKSEADDLIIELMKKYYNCASLSVVSDDNFVMNNSRTYGATIISAHEFYNVSRKNTASSKGQFRGKTSLNSSLKNQINKEMKKLWKID